MEEDGSNFKITTGKPAGRGSLGTKDSWGDIRVDCKEMGVGLIRQDRDYWRVLVDATLNFRVP